MTLTLLASAIPLAGLAQENDQLKPNSRWTFAPHVSSAVHTRILSDLRHHNKFGDNRSIFEIVDNDQNKKKLEAPQHRTQAQLPEVPVTCGTERSPLEAYKAAFGKPIGPVTAVPIRKQNSDGNNNRPEPANLCPKPMPTPSENQQHSQKISGDSRSIVFVKEKLRGIGDSWQTRRLTSWFANVRDEYEKGVLRRGFSLTKALLASFTSPTQIKQLYRYQSLREKKKSTELHSMQSHTVHLFQRLDKALGLHRI